MMLLRADLFDGTHELLPWGLLGGDLVELFRRNKSKYYWFDFTVRGELYRGSNKKTTKRERKRPLLSNSLPLLSGSDPLDRKPPTLRGYSKDFLQWVEAGWLDSESRR